MTCRVVYSDGRSASAATMRAGKEISIGARARAMRSKLGLNQAEVAERVGISTDVYGRFERGRVTPRLQTLLRLCDVLGVTPNDLLINDPNAVTPGQPQGTTSIAAADVRKLVAVLEGADTTTIRRVTEVARWLRPIATVQHAASAAERRGPRWSPRSRKR